MKVLILRDTICGGVPVFAGDVVEASDRDARILMMANKAVESAGESSAPKVRTRKKASEIDESSE